MSKLILLIILTLVVINYSAITHDCTTDENTAKAIEANPSLQQKKDESDAKWEHIKQETGGHTEAWDREHGDDTTSTRRRLQLVSDTIDIPIIIHVLYNTGTRAVDNVQSYLPFIDILTNMNLNFNQQNSDISDDNNWEDILGNMDMTFFINQIHHYDVGDNTPYYWYNSSIKQAGTGAAPIDPSHNLNIWFTSPDSGSPSAYASFPWDTNIGVVANSALINGALAAWQAWGQYRTIFTHELGHWVGLYHIWGYSPVTFDTPLCTSDDFVIDTPNMANKWSNQCPLDGVNSCDEGEPDMFENFMSYASCINMFTDGQVARARANFGIGDDFDRASFVEYMTNSYPFRFVNMIYFTTGTSECMIGDTKRIINLNKDVGGTDIYLCVSYSYNPYVDMLSDIEFMTSESDINDILCPNGYTKYDLNLNEGAMGYIYMCFKKELNPSEIITDLQVFSFDDEYLQPYYRGYKIEPVNLNKFAGGDSWVYMGYKSVKDIDCGDVISAQIASGEKDYYRFNTRSTPYISSVYLQSYDSELDTYLYFYDSNMGLLTSCAGCDKLNIESYLLPSQTYYFAIDGSSSEGGDYSAKLLCPTCSITGIPSLCYDTTQNNPCAPENTEINGYYYPSCSSHCNFIQCDAFGAAFDMPCAPGTIWDQSIRTCNHPSQVITYAKQVNAVSNNNNYGMPITKHNNNNHYFGYIMLISVIAFILINNIFIGCWCLGKSRNQSYVKCDMGSVNDEIIEI